MSIRKKPIPSTFAFLIVLAFCVVSSAQQPQNPPPNQSGEPGASGPRGAVGRGGRHGHGAGGPGMFGPRIMRELNLSDDQRQQIHSIMQQSMEANKPQFEELRQLMEKRRQGTLTTDEEARAKTLREQLGQSRKDTESKIAAVLTPEQKTKLEELMKERANHGPGGRGFRKGPGQDKPQGNPPN